MKMEQDVARISLLARMISTSWVGAVSDGISTSAGCQRLFPGIYIPSQCPLAPHCMMVLTDLSHLSLFGRKGHYHLPGFIYTEVEARASTPLCKLLQGWAAIMCVTGEQTQEDCFISRFHNVLVWPDRAAVVSEKGGVRTQPCWELDYESFHDNYNNLDDLLRFFLFFYWEAAPI